MIQPAGKGDLLPGLRVARPMLSARALWKRLAPPCHDPGCPHARRFWRRMRGRRRQILLQGSRYCADSCFGPALHELLTQACQPAQPAVVTHRIPIGLLLVARQQLTADQLRTALQRQREAGEGRLGEWLQSLGYATEEQVTAALARQWACPVLRGERLSPLRRRVPPIPLTLMRRLAMAPVDFVESTRTLHLAFSEGLDYTVLYAIGQMLECRTAACLVQPSVLEKHFEDLAEARAQSEVLFESLRDATELARIVSSYTLRVGASEVRLAGCGPHIWVRLPRPGKNPLDLIIGQVRGVGHAPEALALAPGTAV